MSVVGQLVERLQHFKWTEAQYFTLITDIIMIAFELHCAFCRIWCTSLWLFDLTSDIDFAVVALSGRSGLWI